MCVDGCHIIDLTCVHDLFFNGKCIVCGARFVGDRNVGFWHKTEKWHLVSDKLEHEAVNLVSVKE